MPLTPDSRYLSLSTFFAPDATGAEHPTIAMRLVGVPAAGASGVFHTVTAGDTLETLAFAYFGDSSLWWRIADANPAAFPFAPEPGSTVFIPGDVAAGHIERTRPF
jgi:nucleoid-associated protein YgaU